MKERLKARAVPLELPVGDPYLKTVVAENASFFTCKSLQDQLQILQNMLKEKPHEELMEFLCTVYLAADAAPAAALRRISFGALRGFPQAEVSKGLHDRLVVLMQLTSTSEDGNGCVHLDNLALLSAWQPHGLEALRIDLQLVLSYLLTGLGHIRKLSQGSTQDRERGYNYASKVARCAAALSKSDLQTDQNKAIVEEICSRIKELLVDDATMLSCRLACGVSLPELTMGVAAAEGRRKASDARTVYGTQRLDLLDAPLPYVCFVSGMINVTAIDEADGLELYEELLSDLDRLGGRRELQQKAPFALTCVRTVVQWVEKLTQDDRGLAARALFEKRLEDLLRIAFQNIEHFVDAVQHQGKALFKLIVEALVKDPSQKHVEFLRRTFGQLIGEPHYRKAKYAPLQTIAKHIEVCHMISADVILEMYRGLREKSMLPYVEDFIRDVGAKCLQEDPESWNRVWVEPFFAVFERGDCAPTIESLLPGLLRLQPTLADEILIRSSSQKEYLLLALKALSPDRLLERPENLRRAQWATDESVKHSLLRLLTECPKSCEPIRPEVIPHIELFLKLNISTQSQALRQAMFSSFKKLLQRAADSEVFWKKPGREHELYGTEKLAEVLRLQNELVTTLWDFCLSTLHPGASFFTRSTALMLLELLAPLANEDRWNQAKANTLLYWIKDTYESNKTAVMNILARAPKQYMPFVDSDWAMAQWSKQAVALTRSARPPDGVTAAYIFRILVKAGRGWTTSGPKAGRLCGDHSSVNGMLMKLFVAILPELRKQVDVARNSGLLEASSSAPMYSALLCVRALLNEILESRLTAEQARRLGEILREVLELSYSISTIASPLVTHPSPEGRMELDEHPELVNEFKAALNKGFGKRLDNADAVKTWAVAAQMLLLCCWRSHREVSLCFGDVSAHLEKVIALEILPENEFVKMGVYFMDELCKVRHRGAFEQASTGFGRLCHSLWRSTSEELRSLPEAWLEEVMDRVASGKVSATRRSAGLPFIVQAIVVTEPEVNGNAALKRAMDSLLPLAAGKDEQARVHALNILRALYRDTRLGESVMVHVSSGVCSALQGFSHPAWRVRNASTLLFSSLVGRIFGVNRSRQDTERKNCLTGNVFFQRFPDLLPFLVDRIGKLVGHIDGHAGLYPILLLLGRLIPSLADSNLAVFLPLLDRCAASPLHGIRVAASKAYASLLPADVRERVLTEKASLLACDNGKIGGNQLHGVLLQIRAVLVMATGTPHDLKRALAGPLKEAAWIAASEHALASAEFIHLLTVCQVRADEVLRLPTRKGDFVPGADQFEAAITKYRLTHGETVDAVKDSEKAAALECFLENVDGSIEPDFKLMLAVIQDPGREHPDVQRMAYELATRHATKMDNAESLVPGLLDRLPSVTYPSVAVALFGLVAALVPRLSTESLRSTIQALHMYSAPNRDPDLRRTAADLAYNILAYHGLASFNVTEDSHLLLTEALVNLVLDNDVQVRNRIVDAVATISTEKLATAVPLEAVLSLAASASQDAQAFGQFLVDFMGPDEHQDAVGWLARNQDLGDDLSLDEQPFEKGELNTFFDSLAVAESFRKIVEEIRPRLKTALELPKFPADHEAALEQLERVVTASLPEIASDRQLDSGLVILGRHLTAQAMVEGRLRVCPGSFVNNVYFERFSKTSG